MKGERRHRESAAANALRRDPVGLRRHVAAVPRALRPGGASPVLGVPLNIQHHAAMQVLATGEFVLNDTDRQLEIRAELPKRSAAI